MKRIKYLLLFGVLEMSCICSLLAQKNTFYLCPEFGLIFSSTTHLIAELNQQDPGVLKFTNANGNMNVTFRKYLVKETKNELLETIIAAEGLTELPVGENIFCQEGKFMVKCASALCMHSPFRYIYAAFDLDEEVLVVRIRCPEDCIRDHSDQVRFLLNSLKPAS